MPAIAACAPPDAGFALGSLDRVDLVALAAVEAAQRYFEVSVKKSTAKKAGAKKAAPQPAAKRAVKTKPVAAAKPSRDVKSAKAKTVNTRSAKAKSTNIGAAKGQTVASAASAPSSRSSDKAEPVAIKPVVPDAAPRKPVVDASQKLTLVPKVSAPAPAARRPLTAQSAGRADMPPEAGFSIVVDGHFKAHHEAEAPALAEAQTLKSRFPFLRIEVFDAVKKIRSSVG